MKNSLKIFFVTGLFLIIFIYFMTNIKEKVGPLKELVISKITNEETIDLSTIRVRDFMFYNCSDIVRIGGPASYVKNAPNKLWRIDGAWFICLDKNLRPKSSDCNVISLGVSRDFTFDKEMRDIYDC